MAENTTGLAGGTKWSLIAGILLLFSAFANGSWLSGLMGLGLLLFVGWRLYGRNLATTRYRQPWPWPPDLRQLAEGMARPLDPTPRRLVPPHENSALVARVATTKDALSRLIAEKPVAWPWAVFASVLLQRRNAVQARLRGVASGYQPRPGVPLSGRDYTGIAQQTMSTLVDVLSQIEQFMLSPAFQGAFGEPGQDSTADADAIIAVGNRLMDYHETLLGQAETCLQTPVDGDAMTFVQDTSSIALLPLLGYEDFIATMCARIGEAQELLPYGNASTVMQLDDVTLGITMPEGLSDRLAAHVKRFNAPPR